MNSFCLQMFAAVLSALARREHEVAGQAIKEARAVLGAGDSDDTAPPNGFNEISDEICEETGYESEESKLVRFHRVPGDWTRLQYKPIVLVNVSQGTSNFHSHSNVYAYKCS